MSINLEECGILKEDILRGVVNQLSEQITRSEISFMESETKRVVAKRTQEIVDQRIGEAVDGMMLKTFQPLDMFGEAKGEPTSIKEMLETSLKTWWTCPVDQKGVAQSRSMYGSKTTRAEWVVSTVAKEVIDKEMSQELRALVADMKAEIKKSMVATISDLVTKNMFR